MNYKICEICHEKLTGRKNKTYPCGHTFHKTVYTNGYKFWKNKDYH